MTASSEPKKCLVPCSVGRVVLKLTLDPNWVDSNPPDNVYPLGHPVLNAKLRELHLDRYVREPAAGHPDRAAGADEDAGADAGRTRAKRKGNAGE